MTAAEVLVVILSLALAVFLILAIILVAYLIVIVQKIKRVASVAERTALNIEGVVATMQKAATPALISKFLMDQISRFTDRRKRKQED